MKRLTAFGLSVLVLLALGGCFFPEPEPLKAVIQTDPNPPQGNPPLTVRFSAQGSTGDIDRFIWTFGDGRTAEGRVVTHTYNRPGNYGVTLRVVGPQGEDTAGVTVHVNSSRPVIEYFQVDRDIVHATQTVYFYASAYDPDGEVRFYRWDFGDGDTATTSQGEISHVFADPGTYTVTLRVEDDNGDLSAPESVTVQVLPPCPCD